MTDDEFIAAQLAKITASLKSATQLRNLRPSLAGAVPTCAFCSTAPAPTVSDGKMPDGSDANFVPTCQACFDKLQVPPPLPKSGVSQP